MVSSEFFFYSQNTRFSKLIAYKRIVCFEFFVFSTSVFAFGLISILVSCLSCPMLLVCSVEKLTCSLDTTCYYMSWAESELGAFSWGALLTYSGVRSCWSFFSHPQQWNVGILGGWWGRSSWWRTWGIYFSVLTCLRIVRALRMTVKFKGV